MGKFLGLKRKILTRNEVDPADNVLDANTLVRKKKPFRPPFRKINYEQRPSDVRVSLRSDSNELLALLKEKENSGIERSKVSHVSIEESLPVGHDGSKVRYFSVMYCKTKKSARAKGPWSDGVLTVNERRFTLQNIAGKVIHKRQSHLLMDTREGASVEIGLFHVELFREALPDEYKSGALFANNTSSKSERISFLPKQHRKLFSKHPGISSKTCPAFFNRIEELHQDAFVLNMGESDKGGSPIFIDPYLNTKLRPHQREGVKFMFECIMGLRTESFRGCLLADEMGLGKTLQVITLLWTMFQQVSKVNSQFRRAVVVCPTSLVQNWGNEVRKWLGTERLRAIVAHNGNSAKEVKQHFIDFKIGNVHPLLITSYELLRKYTDIVQSANPAIIVCDEAHRLKNCAGNKTITALSALKCPRRILLTGTPVQNDLDEFYAMMEFANPGLLGHLSTFRRLYSDPIERGHDRKASIEEKEIGEARSLELQKRTQFCILRRSATINKKYLPRKTEYVVFCRPKPSQISLYTDLLKSKVVTHAIDANNSSNALLAICILRKLCNHPKLVEANFACSGFLNSSGEDDNQNISPQYSFDPSDIILSGKLQCLYSMLSTMFAAPNKLDERVVIASNFTQTLDMIQGLCDHQRWKWLRLDGKTESSSRQLLVDQFNNRTGNESMFLLSSKAGGTGLNLIGANRLVLFDPDWNPATDAQVMARIWREGQQKPVTIYRLLTTGSIEEKMYQRQTMKSQVATTIKYEKSLLKGRTGSQSFSRDELRELFTLNLETSCDTFDLLSQAKYSNIDEWIDCLKKVDDYALEVAIKSQIVSFVHTTNCIMGEKD